ncbi:MAG: hypothetical protein HQL55_19055, partial [Magnetococcales bacterium]|nr:hypothetical protein [Magnetococcales bacterium]
PILFPSSSQGRSSRWSFVLGLLFILFYYGQVGIYPLFDKLFPNACHDTYHYTLRALSLRECLFTPCPAMEQAKTAIETNVSLDQKDTNSVLAWQNNLWPKFVGPPVLPAFYSLVRSFVNDWEEANTLITLLALPLLLLFIALTLRFLFGEGGAGVALILLAGQPFYGRSLDVVAPHTMVILSLFISLLILFKYGKHRPWLVLPCILFLVFSHPGGMNFGLILLGFLILQNGFSGLRRVMPIVLTALPLVFLPLYGHLIGGEVFFFNPLVHQPPMGDLFTNYSSNLDRAIWMNGLSLKGYGGSLFFLAAVFIGIYFMEGEKRLLLGKLLLPTFAIAAILIAHYSPTSTLDAFMRVFNFGLILLTGAVGLAFWHTLAGLFYPAKQLLIEGKGRWLSAYAKPWHAPVSILLLFGCMLFLIPTLFQQLRQGWWHQQGLVAKRTCDQTLDPMQPALIRQTPSQASDILYSNEITFNFFMLHGGLDRGAIPLWNISHARDKWSTCNSRARLLVGMNPGLVATGGIKKSTRFVHGGFRINTTPLIIASDHPLASQTLRLLVKNRHKHQDATILFQSVESKLSPHKLFLPAGSNLWLNPGENGNDNNLHQEFILTAVDNDPEIILQGVRLQGEEKLNWPWDKGISIALGQSQSADKRVISFASKTFFPLNRPMEAISDGGAFVVFRLGSPPDECTDGS